MLFRIDDANISDSEYRNGTLRIRNRFEDESEASFEIFEESVSDIRIGHEVEVSREGAELYAESFESGDLGTFEDVSGSAVSPTVSTEYAQGGTYGVGVEATKYDTQSIIRSEPFASDQKPGIFKAYFLELQSSHGGGIRLLDSDDNSVLGFASDNPQWVLDDTSQDQIYSGDGYERWIEIQFKFNWTAGTYDYSITDTKSGHNEKGTRDLPSTRGFRAIEVQNYSGGTWEAGSDFFSYVDNFSITEKNLLFKGQVHEYTHEQPRPDDSQNFYDVTAKDWHELVSRRVVSGVYDAVPAGTIVKDLIDRFLAEEGITKGVIDDGVTLYDEKIQFQKADRALRRLARKSFLRWWVDSNKTLHFTQPENVNAPFPIDDTLRNIRLHRSREDYRSRQYVASEAGEGAQISYQHQVPEDFENDVPWSAVLYRTEVPFEPASVSEVRVYRDGDLSSTPDIFDCSVGGSFLSSAPKRFLPDVPAFHVNDNFLTEQTTSGTAANISANDIIELDYVPKGRSMVVANSEEAQSARRGVEKNVTGVYADILHDHAAHSYEACKSLARGLVKKFNSMPVQISYTSYAPGLSVGQLQEVDLPSFQTDANAVTIEEITTEDVEREDGKLERKVETEYGNITSWKNYLAEMAENPQPDNPQASGRTQVSGPSAMSSDVENHFGTESQETQDNKTQIDDDLDVGYSPAGSSEDNFYVYNDLDTGIVHIVPLGSESDTSTIDHEHGGTALVTSDFFRVYITKASDSYTSVYNLSDPKNPSREDDIQTEQIASQSSSDNQAYTKIGQKFIFVNSGGIYVRNEGESSYTKTGDSAGGKGNKSGNLKDLANESYYTYIDRIDLSGTVQERLAFDPDSTLDGAFEFANDPNFSRPLVYRASGGYVVVHRYDPYEDEYFLGTKKVYYQVEETLNPTGTIQGMATF